ncbi:MAG TPA: 4,5-DOPA dioxygenase extradiol, partial [Chitinophagales bacterium]|nr:4,5-DOPA dioxygenase extradiol [Chitinophagales bacterium]
MDRLHFIKTSLTGLLGMSTLNELEKFTSGLPVTGKKMPILFVGHGSPMNAIEDNEFSRRWAQLGKEIPQPAA